MTVNLSATIYYDNNVSTPTTMLREAGAATGASRVPLHPGPRLNRGWGRFFFQSLDKPAPSRYNKNEEQTTHAVAPQLSEVSGFTQSNRHLSERRLLSLRSFSFTMIVMVYFPMWKVIRMVPTSFHLSATIYYDNNVSFLTAPLREAGAAAGASRVPPRPGPRLNRSWGFRFSFTFM